MTRMEFLQPEGWTPKWYHKMNRILRWVIMAAGLIGILVAMYVGTYGDESTFDTVIMVILTLFPLGMLTDTYSQTKAKRKYDREMRFRNRDNW